MTFAFDESRTDLVARFARAEPITAAEISAALSSNDEDAILDAYLVIEQHEIRWTNLASLQPELLPLLDGGPTANQEIVFGAANLLSETMNDFWYVGLRQPFSAYVADVTDPGHVEQGRLNWELMIEAANPQRTTEQDGEVDTFPDLTIDERSALAGVYTTSSRCDRDSDGCVFVSLQCKGSAVWNEGNELFLTRWTIVDDGLTLHSSPSSLAEFIGAQPTGDRSEPFRDITATASNWCG